jgi:hypothetical protein
MMPIFSFTCSHVHLNQVLVGQMSATGTVNPGGAGKRKFVSVEFTG